MSSVPPKRMRFSDAIDCAPVATGTRALRAPSDNHLLGDLPPAEYEALAAELEPLYLLPGTCLCEFGDRPTHIYFPTWGMVSLVYPASDGESTELALVGREGAIGVAALIGDDRMTHRALAQTPCAAYRVPVKVLQARFAAGSLQRRLLKYLLSLIRQISQTSVCNLRHPLEQRICRALLESADRWISNALPMTHDEIAHLLGARRQSVTEALAVLRGLGIVSHSRGVLTVVDRAGLEARSCECYGVVKMEAERLRAHQ